MPKGMLIDITLCEGCELCVEACRETNGLTKGETNVLSAYNRTVIKEYENHLYVRKFCMHCLHPSCVSVCPVGALQKEKEGPVVYDEKKCIGCRYCMVAYPFDIPKYEWDKPNPGVRKCVFCFDRPAGGAKPACADVCPTGATLFGDREELIRIARERIAGSPQKYADHVYGQNEFGGTSILFLAPVSFFKLGFPEDKKSSPLPHLTWRVLSLTPGIVLFGGGFLAGLSWVIKRRMKLQTQEMEDHD